MNLISNKDIDRERWDDCVADSEQCRIYALSWYLDAVAGDWDAYILEENGNYVAVFPVPKVNVLVFKVVRQPLFTQQLGLFVRNGKKTGQLMQKVMQEIDSSNSYFLLSIPVPKQSFDISDDVTLRSGLNHVLTLNSSIDEIRRSYSKGQRSNLKNAQKAVLKVSDFDEPEMVIDYFRKNTGKQLSDIREKEYQILLHLFKQAKDKNAAFGRKVTDKEGNVRACGYFFNFSGRVYNVLNASDDEGKANNAATLMLDSVIGEHADTDTVFDFEGSNIPSVAKFFRSFGAQEEPYYILSKNKLPFLLRKIIR